MELSKKIDEMPAQMIAMLKNTGLSMQDTTKWTIDLTKRAADMIKAGEYRFCSGVFDFTSVDPATGEPLLCTLDTIALTNRPFIDGQQPIALTRTDSAVAPRVSLATGAPKMASIPRKALDKALDALRAELADLRVQVAKAPAAGQAQAQPRTVALGLQVLADREGHAHHRVPRRAHLARGSGGSALLSERA